MPTIIVPVGLNLGPSYRYTTPPDPNPEHWEVRLGTEAEELTADEFHVWARAFLDPHRHARLEITRHTLHHDLITAGQGPTTPDAIIDQLLERGLLVEYDPHGPLEKTFRRFKLFPTAEGMGNTPDEPDRYHIGHNGVSLVKVTPVAYGIWAYSSAEGGSIWDFCVGIDEDNQRDLDSGMDLERLTAEEAAYHAAATMPMIIASGCAFLDPVG